MGKEKSNNGFGSIPRKRGRVSVIISSIVFVIILIFIAVKVEKPQCVLIEAGLIPEANNTSTADQLIGAFSIFYQFIFVASIAFLTYMLSEMMRRTCLLIEELHHLDDRYEDSAWKAIKATYRVEQYTPVVLLSVLCIAILVMVVTMTTTLFLSYIRIYLDMILMYMAVCILTNVCNGFKSPSDVEISDYNEKDNLNVAHGLAWSYYFGYLKIILPQLENTIRKSDKWNNFMVEEKLLAKLFIIIPEDCVIPANVGIEDHHGVTFEDKLPALYVDRAGVRGRPYVNSVYQLTDDDRGLPHYCIMEFATPIDSLWKMSEHPEAGLNAKNRHQQVRIFLGTLQHILNTAPECSNRCVLVPIAGRDYKEWPLAKVVTNRIKQLKNETLDMDGADDED